LHPEQFLASLQAWHGGGGSGGGRSGGVGGVDNGCSSSRFKIVQQSIPAKDPVIIIVIIIVNFRNRNFIFDEFL